PIQACAVDNPARVASRAENRNKTPYFEEFEPRRPAGVRTTRGPKLARRASRTGAERFLQSSKRAEASRAGVFRRRKAFSKIFGGFQKFRFDYRITG
ncbi:hypothetical protein, partial [Sutterella seckii]|uniref:hypothetical protein n=1 Tax=Sutterella seckii TaxID=1944635 RepID=UPI001D053FE5